MVAALALAAASRASTEAVRDAFEPGRQMLYHLTYSDEGVDRITAALGSGATSDQRFTTDLDAVLTVTTLERDARGATLIWNLVQPHIVFHSGDALEGVYNSALSADAVRPFVTRVDLDGRVVRFACDAAVSDLGAGLMRRIVATMQIVAPQRASYFDTQWTRDEPAVDGLRRSSYALDPWISPLFGEREVRFRRASALSAPAVTGGEEGIVVRGEAIDDGHWRLDGVLGDLNAFETRTVTLDTRVVARSQALLRVQALGAAALAADRLSAARDYAGQRLAAAATGLHVVPVAAEVERSAFTSMLGNDTAATLAIRLAAQDGKPASPAQTTLAAEYGALVALHPAEIPALERALANAPGAGARFAILLQGFERAGTPQAQAALARVAVRREAEPAAATPLAIGLGLQRRPTLAAESALYELALRGDAEVRDAAELGLGSVARAEAHVAPDRAKKITALLLEHLAAATTAAGRRTELLALGNAADPSTIDAIAAYAGDRERYVRAAAATALRHFDDARSDAVLASLLGDADANVRVEAAAAFQSRPIGNASFERLSSLALNDPDATVRGAAVQSLWSARLARPEVRTIVAHVASGDANGRVRATAQRAIDADVAETDPEIAAPQTQLGSALP
jgi:hypothetical protein